MIDAAGRARSRISDSIVRFKRLSGAEMDAYIASGEGLGKAGGYAIQGTGRGADRLDGGQPFGRCRAAAL